MSPGPLYAEDGRILIPGKVGDARPRGRIIIDEHFTSNALPSTLAISGSPAGTGTYYGVAGEVNGTGTSSGVKPGYKVTSGAASGNQAALAAKTINSSLPGIKQIHWTVEGLTLDSAATYLNCDISIALYGGNLGGWFGQAQNATQAGITFNGPTRLLRPCAYNWTAANEGISSRNLTMVYVPPDKEIWVLSDDQVIAWSTIDVPGNWADGVLTPNITLTTREAVAHSFTVQRVALSIVTQ